MKINNTLGKKIGLGFAALASIFVISVFITTWKVDRIGLVTKRLVALRSPTAMSSLEMLNGINHSLAALRGWMILGETRFKEERTKAWSDEIRPSLESMERLSKDWTDPRNLTRLVRIREKVGDFETAQREIEAITHTLENQPAKKILVSELMPQANILIDTITTMIDLEEEQAATPDRKRLLKVMADIRGISLLALTQIKGFLISGDGTHKEAFETLWKKDSLRFVELAEKSRLLTPKQHEVFEQFSRARELFDPMLKKMFEIRSGEKWNISNHLLKTKAAPTAFAIKEILNKMTATQKVLMTDEEVEILGQIRLLTMMAWSILFVGLLVCAVLGVRITHAVTGPISKTVASANAIASGDYDLDLEIGGSLEIAALGKAMNGMRINLKQLTLIQEQQLWLANSKTVLGRKMSGGEDIVDLSRSLIHCLADLLKADIGAVYLAQEDERLKLIASYAYTDRGNNFNEFQTGEGLVGQAALEKETILFSDVPEETPGINYGLGKTHPAHFLVTPILYEGDVKGVITLGAMQSFTPEQRTLIDQVRGDIGSVINTAQSQEQIAYLLKETTEQAEAMRHQQAALEQSNCELEEQTAALKESEEELKTQQEELQAINEELEEKTESLERQRDELEKARRETEAKANDLEKTGRYKSEFLANMSHELRTPLNSLLILSATLLENEEKTLSEDQLESVEVINSSGKDLLNLINEILDLSKVESGKMGLILGDLNLESLASNLERNFKHVAEEKGVSLKTTLAEGLPASIKTDCQKVKQILKNLLSNALKFTEEGEVAVRIGRPDTNDFSKNGLDPRQTIAISVSDSGIGIPHNKHALVFQAFKQVDGTTKRKYGGTGLGLSISKKFARILGGRIDLRSQEGKGSTFTLLLPEVPVSEKKQEEVEDKGIPPQNNGHLIAETPATKYVATPAEMPIADDRDNLSDGDKTLLIIEDDPKFSKILLDVGRKKGFKCLAAGDGESGIKLANDYKPKAILLDIMLPGIDGWTVIDRLKENPDTRHIPVHFISALDENIDALKKGAIGYLSKPVDKAALDGVFQKIEGFIAKEIKQLMVIESKEEIRRKIAALLASKAVKITFKESGEVALEALQSGEFDCIVTDAALSDMSACEFLERIEADERLSRLPVIVYTDQELTREEDGKLKEFADSIIIKGAKSMERLLDETALFLHQVERDLPEKQQKMIRRLHDKEALLKNKKVLIVDDDMRNTFALSKLLKKRGMDVFKAENGKVALDCLDKTPDVDLVLMDNMMPVMDGFEATRAIRKQGRFKNLPILALTAKAMKGDREKCLESGVNDYLPKPIDVEKLFSMMRIWLYR